MLILGISFFVAQATNATTSQQPLGPIARVILSPYAVAIVTVFATVGVSHLAIKRRQEINALRALRVEVMENRSIAESQLSFIDSSIAIDEPIDEISAFTRTLQTEAYTYSKNSGALWRLNEEIRGRILDHYEFVNDVNSALDHRRDIFLQMFLPEEKSLLERVLSGAKNIGAGATRIDALAFHLLYPLHPEEFENLDNTHLFLELHGYDSPDDVFEHWGEGSERIDFGKVIEALDETIEDRQIFGLF